MARRRPRQQCCRAIVLWTAAAFVLMQLALGVAVDVLLPQVRDPEYVHREQLLREQIACVPEKPLVVMIGSSRVLNGFDAETAAAALHDSAVVFNFGIPSSGPFLEEIWLERLKSAGVRCSTASRAARPSSCARIS